MKDFNYNRFKNELKVDIQFFRRKFIKKTIINTGLMVLYSCVFLPLIILADENTADKPYFYKTVLNIFYTIVMVMLFIFYALSHMQEMHSKEGRINVLIRPSTTKEKFVAKSLIVLIAPILTFVFAVTINESAIFLISKVINGTELKSFFCYSDKSISFFQSCFYVINVGHPVIQILIFVATILLSQAFCLYISNAQQRFIALKAISGIVAFAATIILILHYVYPRTEFFYGIIYPQKSGVLIDKKIILMLIFLLVEIWLTIFLWRKSYKMFKSSQITNSINNK